MLLAAAAYMPHAPHVHRHAAVVARHACPALKLNKQQELAKLMEAPDIEVEVVG